MAGRVQLEREGAVGVLTLDNAPTLNAFDLPMAEQLAERAEAAAGDGAIRALLLRGKGAHFCAGGDLGAMRTAPDPADYVLKLARTANRALVAVRGMGKPVLAELKGAVAGGGVGIAMACDLRLAADTTKVSLAFLRVGLVPDMGSTWTLPRAVGRGRAFALATAADPLPVAQALEWGLVDRVVSASALEAESRAWALQLSNLAPLAVAELKSLFEGGEDRSFGAHLHADSAAIARAAGSRDFKEGAAAFFEKRPARFEGR